ncbi:hypothetical protein AACH06_25765 [Ideonella sp. DXS29W]|uniref:Uncharacterized protein n=1 Tax=Ideonella lacteola TaxID=2984193 RepID=A0ABU9BXU0_9BURK
MLLMAKSPCDKWTPVVVETAALEAYWSRGNYWPSYRALPECYWFDHFYGPQPAMFNLGTAYFESNFESNGPALSFTSGRHRTRWMLERGAQNVVLALSKNTVDAAAAAGLVSRTLQEKEWFELGFVVESHAMAHRNHPGPTCEQCRPAIPELRSGSYSPLRNR